MKYLFLWVTFFCAVTYIVACLISYHPGEWRGMVWAFTAFAWCFAAHVR